jgi:hypothetical protein
MSRIGSLLLYFKYTDIYHTSMAVVRICEVVVYGISKAYRRH